MPPASRQALPCVCLTGPTACGKTELALELAERFPVEIVSMDSAMIYRGMDIGTATPGQAILDRVPHHLISMLDPAETYSAGRFAADAATAVAAIRARGNLPLIVGGTLLYLRALRDGLTALPTRDAGVRAKIDAEAAKIGWPAMHRRLAGVDPAAARRIAPSDRQRIQRALEVYLLSGEPRSMWHQRRGAAARTDMAVYAIMPDDRAALAARIRRRFTAMVEAGFIQEVQTLKARPDLTAETPSMRSVGYRQIWAYLDGAIDRAEAERRALSATRQLAKRQLTWLRADARSERLRAFAPGLGDILAGRIEALRKVLAN
jgi:tRNA dimethylallyltransferase